jgi:hypothetical protein
MDIRTPVLSPSFDRTPSAVDVRDHGEIELPGCVKLWRAVIRQAAADAMGPPCPDRERARRWLTKPSADVDLALSNAGLDRERVLAWARELAQRDWKPLLRG